MALWYCGVMAAIPQCHKAIMPFFIKFKKMRQIIILFQLLLLPIFLVAQADSKAATKVPTAKTTQVDSVEVKYKVKKDGVLERTKVERFDKQTLTAELQKLKATEQQLLQQYQQLRQRYNQVAALIVEREKMLKQFK